MFLEKSNSMKLNDLVEGQGRGQKGDPKNEGISVDVYENKGQEFRRWECL